MNSSDIIPIGRHHYLVESASTAGEWHSVDTEDWHCSCKGFQCLGYCWHIVAVKRLEQPSPPSQESVNEPLSEPQ